jgi:hypothetical protein
LLFGPTSPLPGASTAPAPFRRELVLKIGPRQVTLPLSHWDGDTLVMEHVLEFKMAGERSLVHFNVGGGGQATSLKIDLLNGNGLGTFRR